MLYHFLYPLVEESSIFNIFKYITFRSSVAFVLATFFSIYFGKHFIKYMSKKQFGQVVRDDGPETHLVKRGTPTMGGIFIFFSILLSLTICGNLLSPSVLAFLAILISFTCLGFLDDYLKVLKKDTAGISGKAKIIWQLVTSLVVLYVLITFFGYDTNLYIPFIKSP